MKAEDIEKLPKEFDFKAKDISTWIVYHAREMKNNYKITWNIGDRIASQTYSKEGFHRNLHNGTFEII